MSRNDLMTLFSRYGFGYRLAVSLLLLSFIFTGIRQGDAAESANEYILKSTFLYNFSRYTEWPLSAFESLDSPLYICIVGEYPVKTAFKHLQNKKINDRSILVSQRKIDENFLGCHVVFVSLSEKFKVEKILRKITSHVLTVSDISNFSSYGGVIGLQTIRNKMRFSVNLKSAKQHGLKISARLLRLAISVEE